MQEGDCVKRDYLRDYATEAFARYGKLGEISRETYSEKLKQDIRQQMRHLDPGLITKKVESELERYSGMLDDIEAARKTLEYFTESNRQYISDAVRAVYMAPPHNVPSHREVVYRVRYHALCVPVTEKQVYKWLQMARVLFAKERGLAFEMPPGFTMR